MTQGLEVSGGAGGTAAELADLDMMAGALAGAGEDLAVVAARLRALAADPRLLGTGILAPWSAVRLESALLAACFGPTGAGPTGVAVAALATAVRTATWMYRTTDRAIAGVLRRLELTAGLTAGRALAPVALGAGAVTVAVSVVAGEEITTRAGGPAGGSEVAGAGRRVGEVLLGLLGREAGVGDHVVAAVPGLLAGISGLAPVGDVRSTLRAGIAGAGATPWLRESAAVRVQTSPPRPIRPSSGLGEVMARTAELSRGAVAPPGTIRVDRVTAADGTRSWVVHIPGTQSWSPRSGANPMDLTTDVHALAGRPSAAGAAVVDGLRVCGARRGEPVLLAGHSLGGIAAAELAADPDFRRRFTVTHVLTAGAPVAISEVPQDVQVLSLEHDTDPVVWLDGAQNPDRASWVTVRRPVEDVAASHDGAEYRRTASLVDTSSDGSLRRWRDGLSAFVDGPGASATSWQVTGHRVSAGDGEGRVLGANDLRY